MNYFLNLKNGKPSISTNALAGAKIVDMVDIIASAGNKDAVSLTANLSDYIDSECEQVLSEYGNKFIGESYDEVSTAILGDLDFLDQLFNALDSDEYLDYPDLRDPQNDLIYKICEQSKIN